MLAAVTGTNEHVPRNRAVWDRLAAEYAEPGLRGWAQAAPAWGIWQVPEAQAGVLPADLASRDSIELGCGTGYVSAWLAYPFVTLEWARRWPCEEVWKACKR
jgi:hypothetical protein